MPERQLHGLDDLEGTLDDIISRSLGDALAAQSGTSTQNIAAQIQQSTPLKKLIEQIANEITQQNTDRQDETIQQALTQQAINNFGTSTSQSTIRRNTKEGKDIPDEMNVETVPEQEQQKDTDSEGPTPEKPTTDESTEPSAEKEEPKKPQSEIDQDQPEEPPIDEPSKPSIDDSQEVDEGIPPQENTQPPQHTQERTAPDRQPGTLDLQTQQQLQAQQVIQNTSKQQLTIKLKQLQEQKRKLQKKLLDETDTEQAFGIDQAALFVPALTTLAYVVDLIDITEFIAPMLDIIIACISAYVKFTRSAKLKLFYLKQLPEFLVARLFGMIPFVSYIAPEVLQEIKSIITRFNKFNKARHAIQPLKKQIEQIETQIKHIQKQLSKTSLVSRIRGNK